MAEINLKENSENFVYMELQLKNDKLVYSSYSSPLIRPLPPKAPLLSHCIKTEFRCTEIIKCSSPLLIRALSSKATLLIIPDFQCTYIYHRG